MDGRRFDSLVKSLGRTTDRRAFARVLVGAVGLGVVRFSRATTADAAFVCRKPGEICRKPGECCTNICGPADATGRQRCQCSTTADCPAPDQCHVATCVAGVCGTTVLVGQLCNDRNACTTGEKCQGN